MTYFLSHASGTWAHFVATYSAATSKANIYVNGATVKQADGTGYLSDDWDGLAGFGMHRGLPEDFVYIDEIRMFNRALDSFEVKNLFGKCNFVWNGGERLFNGSRADFNSALNVISLVPLVKGGYFC